MDYQGLKEHLLGKVNRGDLVIIEYPSTYPVERLAWGFVIPLLAKENVLVVWDFFGLGNLLFKNYVRKNMKAGESIRLLELLKEVKVVKIGPGIISYGEVIEEVSPSYRVQDFIKNYYLVIQKMGRLPMKPAYLLTFGLANYVAFGNEDTLRNIITALSTIPMEDWATINFINADIISEKHLSMLEEIATDVFYVSKEGIELKKDGGDW